MKVLDSLRARELFHLEFLRWLTRKVKREQYALKGGVNLRFFFRSIRYSEDMDLDVQGISVAALKDTVMGILTARSFQDNFKPFGIAKVIPPDPVKAKQTQTTQRFKIHLITFADEDLFTKIEFSRRGIREGTAVETVSAAILRDYKLAPLLLSHYDAYSAAAQKIEALASRAAVQARDIFDLYVLSAQFKNENVDTRETTAAAKLSKAQENVYAVSFEQFRDTVLSYLSPEERIVYDNPSVWDEIRLKTAGFISEFGRSGPPG